MKARRKEGGVNSGSALTYAAGHDRPGTRHSTAVSELRQRARHGLVVPDPRALPACGLRYERDEENEYWLGAYTLNFIVTEVLFAAGLLVVLVLTWPGPPWTAILWGGAAQMILTPIVFYRSRRRSGSRST